MKHSIVHIMQEIVLFYVHVLHACSLCQSPACSAFIPWDLTFYFCDVFYIYALSPLNRDLYRLKTHKNAFLFGHRGAPQRIGKLEIYFPD